jgi:hypothetical protein
MVTPAANPNLSPSDVAGRFYSPPLDKALELRDYAATAIAVTTAGAAVSFYSAATTAFEIVLRNAAIGGTVDGSNLWTITVTADNESSFTSPITLLTHVLPATAGNRRFIVPSEEVQRLAGIASMATAPNLIRVTATETGTTAGDLTYGCWIEPVSPV